MKSYTPLPSQAVSVGNLSAEGEWPLVLGESGSVAQAGMGKNMTLHMVKWSSSRGELHVFWLLWA